MIEGTDAMLTCVYERSNVHKKVIWRKNEEDFFLFNGNNLAVDNHALGSFVDRFKPAQQNDYSSEHRIILTNAASSDEGSYSCRVETGGTSISSAIKDLIVISK